MPNHNPLDPNSRYSTQELLSLLYIKTKYLGVTKDATMAVELSTTQFQACQDANGQIAASPYLFSH